MICYGDKTCQCKKCLSSPRGGSAGLLSRRRQRKRSSEPVVHVGNGLPVPAKLARRLQRSDQLDAELQNLGLPGLDDLDDPL